MLHSVIADDHLQVAFGYEHYTELLGTSGTCQFADALRNAIECTVKVDEFMVFCRRSEAVTPVVLLSFGSNGNSEARAEAYRARYHRFDPLSRLLDDRTSNEVVAIRICSDEITKWDYRRVCYN
jgi:hypothetical protein